MDVSDARRLGRSDPDQCVRHGYAVFGSLEATMIELLLQRPELAEPSSLLLPVLVLLLLGFALLLAVRH
jgi:hypothetical protein